MLFEKKPSKFKSIGQTLSGTEPAQKIIWLKKEVREGSILPDNWKGDKYYWKEAFKDFFNLYRMNFCINQYSNIQDG